MPVIPLRTPMSLIELWVRSMFVSRVRPRSALMSLTEFSRKLRNVKFVSPLSELMSVIEFLLTQRTARPVSPLSALMSVIELSPRSRNVKFVSSLSELMSVIELGQRSRFVRLVRFWIPTRLSIPASRASRSVSPATGPHVRSSWAPTESAALIAVSRFASSNVAMAASEWSLQSSPG